MINFGRSLKCNLKHLSFFRRSFSEIVPSSNQPPATGTPLPKEVLTEISRTTSGLTPEDYIASKKTGADLYLTPEKKSALEAPGFFFNDVNEAIDLEANSYKGWKLQYLKNMLLLQDYNNIFRDFLQSCALNDNDGLELTCESRFKQCLQSNLNPIITKGYNFEIDSLRILQNFQILNIEIFKNLKVNRFENKELNKYEFKLSATPLGPMVIAHEIGNDHSLAKDHKPFILATTMLVKTPMKMAIFNQNLKKKIHGLPEDQVTEYVVRFESQFSYSDFFWILPTQNKPKRLRSTKIADFNNIMRGNPFFSGKFDLCRHNKRYNYMNKDEAADQSVNHFIDLTHKI